MIRDKQVIADDIHGETGLDGPVFAPLRKKAEDKHAVLYIIDTLMASDGDITLVPTGPLTNIAMQYVWNREFFLRFVRLCLWAAAISWEM